MTNEKSKIISKKDDIKNTDAWKLIENHRQTESGLITPLEHVEFREERCGYCGQGYAKFAAKGRYFGEVFHDECCKAMLRGERAN